ncbi:MAG: nucleoside 2-deoxyribosyltransferase [Azonexus sp.]
MKKRIVYLAGLISTDHPESLTWRDRVTPKLEAAGFEVRTPLAGKKTLKADTSDGGITTSVTSNRAICLRDRRDVREADVVLANLELFGSPRPLVGTVVELGWAWDDKTPVVAAVAEDNYLMRKHPFISEFVTQYWPTIDEAVDFVIRYYGSAAS